MKETIRKINALVEDSLLPLDKIMPMSDEGWWLTQVERYGFEDLYKMVQSGIKEGRFSFSDGYFMVDSETLLVYSFDNKEEICELFKI